MLLPSILSLSALSALAIASPAAPEEVQQLEERDQTNYSPQKVACPAGASFVRPANGLNPQEASYVARRKVSATNSFKQWLAKTNSGFPVFSSTSQYPTIGLVDGGGGLRGFLLCAGVHQAFDSDEPVKYSTSGLYQSMTYEAGLSGSSDSLNSYAYNNWPLTSVIAPQLWIPAFANGVTHPMNGPFGQVAIMADVRGKQANGFPTTVVDTWGRLLAYATLQSANHGHGQLLSDLPTIPGFANAVRPFPISTAIGVENIDNGCGLPPLNASQYEFTPFEFGSWEQQIGNFMNTKYIGTTMSNGAPNSRNAFGKGCVTGFDNVGWVSGVSTNTFNQACGRQQNSLNNVINPDSAAAINGIFSTFLSGSNRNNFALLPNPFQNLASAPAVSNEDQLLLIDGGETIQVPPIWPFLFRPDVSVLFVTDNSADNPSNYPPTGAGINFPSGVQLRNTWEQAQANGVGDRMPYIPTPDIFQQMNFNKAPMTIFGCEEPAAKTIIYLPNRPVVFNSDQDAGKLKYTTGDSQGMIKNGIAIATNNGDTQFATCMGCAAMLKASQIASKSLPSACQPCFQKYCAFYS